MSQIQCLWNIDESNKVKAVAGSAGFSVETDKFPQEKHEEQVAEENNAAHQTVATACGINLQSSFD
jgi:hypothetical protein